MPEIKITASDIEGYIPAVDPRKIAKPFVLSGQNYIFDIDGPKSYFSAKILNYKLLELDAPFWPFTVEEELFLCTDNCIYGYDETNKIYTVLFSFASDPVTWPWSVARVGFSYFFCRKGIGVIQYNLNTLEWKIISDVYFPSDPRWITQSAGRLIVLGEEQYSWSAQDDGEDMTPSLVTGAGIQAISALTGGTAYRVDEILDGFLVATSQGLIKAQQITSAAVFRHTILSRQIKLFSPFCAAPLVDYTVVYLTGLGFHVTSGQTPQPWQELMSEEFAVNIIPSTDRSIVNMLRLDYIPSAKSLYVSLSSISAPGTYGDTRVLYFPSNKWGQFNRIHTGIGEYYLRCGPCIGPNVGYTDVIGAIHILDDAIFNENFGTISEHQDDLWVPAIDYAPRFEDGEWIFSSDIIVWHENPIAWDDYVGGRYSIEGLSNDDVYSIESDGKPVSLSLFDVLPTVINNVNSAILWYATTADQLQLPLYSEVTLGLFTITDNQAAGEYSCINEIIVSTQPGGVASVATEDWLSLYEGIDFEEDWAALADETEDYGFNIASAQDYGVFWRQTNDGKNLIETGEEELDLVQDYGGARWYSTEGFRSKYHALKMTAKEVGQTFRLKSLELTGILAGRFGE